MQFKKQIELGFSILIVSVLILYSTIASADGNGMYSKLVFIVDRQRIEFSAYELITIAQQIVRERQENLARNEVILPDHDAIDESLEENFWNFTRQLTDSLERAYQLARGKIFGFVEYAYNICKKALSLIFTIVTEPENKELLDTIKTKEKTRCFEIQLTRRIIIPLPLMQMNTIRQWIFIAKYLAENYQRMELTGWWFRIGGRVIRLRNDAEQGMLPEGNRQFYAADHGFEEAIVRNTGRHIERTIRSFTWNDSGGTFFRAFRFWRFYTLAEHPDLAKITIAQHQNSLREEFIYHLSRNNGIMGSPDLCQLLLLSLASDDPSLRGTFEESRWQFRHSWELGNRGIIDRPETLLVEPLPEVARRQYAAIFDDLIEQFRYVTQAIVQQRVSFMRDALNPFHTQIRQIMHEEVAGNYIMAHVLCELAKAINHGRQEPLFRELSSYGDRESGDTYPRFERSIAEYFGSTDHLNEAALATEMRSILAGNPVRDERLGFLPCLTAAWFISETARNLLTTMASLILLDMLESNIVFSTPGVDNWYQWRNVLIHPQTGVVGRVRDVYGTRVDRITDFAGCHPMVHTGSVNQAQDEPNPDRLNIVHQKEGHLIIHWLQLVVDALPRAERDNLRILAVRAEVGEAIGDIREKKAAAEKKLKKIQGTIRVKRSNQLDTSREETQAKQLEESISDLSPGVTYKNMIQSKVIESFLRSRMSNLRNMLSDMHQVVGLVTVTSTKLTGIARKMAWYTETGSSRTMVWYTDDMINELMDHYFGNLDFGRMHAININADRGGVLLQNLRQREELIAQLERLGTVVPHLLVPVNLGRYDPNIQTTGDHWVGLYIVRHPINSRGPQILYFDPLGNSMPIELRLLLQDVYPTAEYVVNPIRFQYDGYNCGPWIVEIFRSLVRTNGIHLPPENLDIEAVRLEHNTILFPDVIPVNPPLSQQPVIVENTTPPLLPIWSIRWNHTEQNSLSHRMLLHLCFRPRSFVPMPIFFISP